MAEKIIKANRKIVGKNITYTISASENTNNYLTMDVCGDYGIKSTGDIISVNLTMSASTGAALLTLFRNVNSLYVLSSKAFTDGRITVYISYYE